MVSVKPDTSSANLLSFSAVVAMQEGRSGTQNAEIEIGNSFPLHQDKRPLRRRLLLTGFVADLAAIAAAFALAWIIRFGNLDVDSGARVIILFMPIYALVAINRGVYSIEALVSFWRCVGSALLALGLSLLILMLAFFAVKAGEISRLMMFYSTVLSASFLTLTRAGIHAVTARTLGKVCYSELIIVDGVSPPEERDAIVLQAQDLGLRPEVLDAGLVERMARLTNQFDSVTICCRPENREAWAFLLKAFTVRGQIRLPEIDPLMPLGLNCQRGENTAIVSQPKLAWHQAVLKRAFDLVLTSLALILVAPVLVMVAIAIRLESPGPILFRQLRIGHSNRAFTVYKFRSMRIQMQDDRAVKLVSRGDARVTRVGRFIRAMSIDELPQLLNVLKGDMSLVGPRPHAPLARAGGALYWDVNRAYWHRHAVKPGITGLAQVRGFRGNTFTHDDLHGRLNADLAYIRNWSLWNDIRILISTLRVLRHDNAY